MPKSEPVVVRITSTNDIVATIPRLVGFQPRNSIVVACLHHPRDRIGLVLRFDIEAAWNPKLFAAHVAERVRFQDSVGVLVGVYTDMEGVDDRDLPYFDVIDALELELSEIKSSAYLVVGEQFWTYCHDPRCCPPGPTQIDLASPGATAMAAAHAMQGRAMLADRQALAASIAYDGDDDHRDRMYDAIIERDAYWLCAPLADRRAAMLTMLSRLSGASHSRDFTVSDEDVVEFAALCNDVMVRDEVLVRALKARRREPLQRVLTALAKRVPPPDDAPVCSVLAWVAYRRGEGALANVALERALTTDPEYSFALLIEEFLDRQIAPEHLDAVMRGARRELQNRSAAG